MPVLSLMSCGMHTTGHRRRAFRPLVPKGPPGRANWTDIGEFYLWCRLKHWRTHWVLGMLDFGIFVRQLAFRSKNVALGSTGYFPDRTVLQTRYSNDSKVIFEVLCTSGRCPLSSDSTR